MQLCTIYVHCISVVSCGRPELFTASNDSVPNIEGILSAQGSTVMFSCPPKMELLGPPLSTCTMNGEWEPDPSGVMCNDSKGYIEFIIIVILLLIPIYCMCIRNNIILLLYPTEAAHVYIESA